MYDLISFLIRSTGRFIVEADLVLYLTIGLVGAVVLLLVLR